MATWLNDDGLYIKFGTDEGKSLAGAGVYKEFGETESLSVDIDLTALAGNGAAVIINDVASLPKGAQLVAVELTTLEVAADGTSLDVGLINVSRKTGSGNPTYLSANEDDDAILAAYVTATMNGIGEYYYATFVSGSSIPDGVTTRGAAIGQVLTGTCLITANVAGTYSAGKVRVRVHYIPNASYLSTVDQGA